MQAGGPSVIISTNGAAEGGVIYEAVFFSRENTARIDDDRHSFWNGAGASALSLMYANFQASNDGLGRVRTGTNVVNDLFGQPIPGDNSRLTLFDIVNAVEVGLDYVQLGRVSRGPANGVQTYFAVGAITSLPVMPTTGSASYAGGTRGTYLTGSGAVYDTASDINLTANFGTGQITGATSNFRMIDANGAAVTAPATLNFNFNANMSGRSFSGTASNPTMTGSVNGAFYGAPGGAPTEAGLAYSLSETAGGGKLVGVGGVRRQ